MDWRGRDQRLDRSGRVLLMRQIADDIRAAITSGDLPPGARLPSGPELAETYRVSVPTIRRAQQLLIDDGLLEISHGHGTYVTKKS